MIDEQQIQIRVRYCEADPMGYLHHSNYFVYFEMGRTELLRAQHGSYREMEEQGLLMVVVKLECHFRAPARFDDLLTLTTRMTRVTPAKLEHSYQIHRDGLLLTDARSVLACVDRDGKMQRIPEGFPGLQP